MRDTIKVWATVICVGIAFVFGGLFLLGTNTDYVDFTTICALISGSAIAVLVLIYLILGAFET